MRPSFSAPPETNADDPASITVTGQVVDVLKLPIAHTTLTRSIRGTNQIFKVIWTAENGNVTIKIPAKQRVIGFVTPGFRTRAFRSEYPAAGTSGRVSGSFPARTEEKTATFRDQEAVSCQLPCKNTKI